MNERFFRSISEIKPFVGELQANYQMKRLEPFIDIVQEKYIKKLLGDEFYTDFLALYYSGGIVADSNNYKLLIWVQRTLANYLFAEAIPHLRNAISELGIQQSYTDSSSISRPATDQSIKAQQLSFVRSAYDSAEAMLLFLEKNADKDEFASWKEGSGFTIHYQSFIQTATDYSRFLHAVSSRQVFLALKPSLLKVERHTLESVFGALFYKNLKDYQKASILKGDLSIFPVAPYNELIEKIKEVLCYKTLHSALPYLDVSIDGDKLFLNEFDLGAEKKTPADQRRYEQLREQLDADYNVSFKNMLAYIETNVDEFPLYRDNEYYQKKLSECRTGKSSLPNNAYKPDFWL